MNEALHGVRRRRLLMLVAIATAIIADVLFDVF